MKKQQNDPYDFPHDVLENILSRLPVKSLLRLKAVCKSWNAVIEDPGFAGTHSKQSNISNSQCFFTDRHGDVAYSLITFDGHEFYRESIPRFQSEENRGAFFYCSCEGILVFEYNTYKGMETTRERMFLLLNPFTRNLSTFSCPCDDEKHTNCICRSQGYGLCFDKYEDDYKFVAVLGGGKYLVYSFGNESWIERRSELGGCVSSEGIYVNGVVYWVVVSNGIVYFDPKDDLLKKLHAPEDLRHELRFDLTNMRGNLCLFARDDEESVTGIWLLKEDQKHKCWKKIATVENKRPKDYDPEFFFAHCPLFYLTLENKLVFRNWYSTRYAVYDPDRKRFSEIYNFPRGIRIIVLPCLQSLHFPAIPREGRLDWDQFSSPSSVSVKLHFY